MSNRYEYTEEDDVLACYVAKYGEEILISPITASKTRGMTEESFKARVENFKAIEGKSRLTHVAEMSREVYETYKPVSKGQHRTFCLSILGISK
ncbi:protein of unknown function [Pseudodesulfovibrio profundus]|uniref:Uncharacterized protein n=1 Tax=Pseudodesulfovibrio profundus TaxID=57320 RepID=A0A2C8FDK4_9BACT|nr:hypothetical protein [Pseudodesulfovibrio profundus]SOB59972.1 protein of unknown function [Pseudodesulfovibrio profundus]